MPTISEKLAALRELCEEARQFNCGDVAAPCGLRCVAALEEILAQLNEWITNTRYTMSQNTDRPAVYAAAKLMEHSCIDLKHIIAHHMEATDEQR